MTSRKTKKKSKTGKAHRKKKATTRKKAGRKPAKAQRRASSGKKAAGSRKAAPKKKTSGSRKKAGGGTREKKAGSSKKSPSRKAASQAAPSTRAKAPSKKRPSRARSRRSQPAGPPTVAGAPIGGDRKSKLGRKWGCFQCGAKFYDLNHPEPICPRCGTDQRAKPQEAAPPPPSPQRGRASRPLAPLLEEEDEPTREAELSSDDLELELTGLGGDDDEISEADLDIGDDEGESLDEED